MSAPAEFQKLLDEDQSLELGTTIDVNAEPLISNKGLERIVAGPRAALPDIAAAFNPDKSIPKPVRFLRDASFEALLDEPGEFEQEPHSNPPPFTPQQVRELAQLGVSTAIGFATGGASIPAQIGIQGVGGVVTDVATRFLQDEDQDPLASGASGAVNAAAEGLSRGATKGGAVIFRAGRKLVSGARKGLRGFRGAPHTPERGKSFADLNAPFREFLDEGAESAIQIAEDAGGMITAGQAVSNNIVDNMEKVADAAILSSGRIRGVREGTQKLIRKQIDQSVAALPSMSRESVGEVLEGLVSKRIKRITGIAQGHYRAVDNVMNETEIIEQTFREVINDPVAPLTPKVIERTVRIEVPKHGVSLVHVKENAQLELDRIAKGIVSPRAAGPLKRIMGKPDVVTFEEAQAIRSDLFDLSQQFNPTRDAVLTRQKAAAARTAKKMTGAINEAASSAPGNVRESLDAANALWREEVRGKLTGKVIKKILKDQPEDVLDVMIRQGKPSFIREVRELVMKEDPGAWKSVQGAYIKRLLTMSGEEAIRETGERQVIVNGQKLLNNLARFGREDDAALKAMFPGVDFEQVKSLRTLANALKFAEREAGSGGTGTGSVFINISQAGAIGGLFATGGALLSGEGGVKTSIGIGSIAILVGPAALSRMMTNRTMVRWLTVGAASPPGSQRATRAAFVLLGQMLKEGIVSEEDEESVRSELSRLDSELKQ